MVTLIIQCCMNNQNRIFENLFQFANEPIYVEQQQPHQADDSASGTPNHTISPKNHKKNRYCSILSAITSASPNTVIKIGQGLYVQNNQLMTGGVRLQAIDPACNVVITSEMYSSLIINLPFPEDEVWIQNIKFAHLCEHEKGMVSWPGMREMRENRYLGLQVSESLNTSILVKRGILHIDECRFSMAGQRDTNRVYPSIVVEQEGTLNMTRSEVIGGSGSVGIYCNGGRLNVRECVIKDHSSVGILVSGGKGTSCLLKNSVVSDCSEGIVLNGPFSGTVENNVIEKCSHMGLGVTCGNSSSIINNQVLECCFGVQIENSCPKVMKNTLARNKEFGLSTHSRMNGECQPLVRFNVAQDNKKGGMRVGGSRNRSQLCNNTIQLNHGVGLQIESNAHPHIFLNEINRTTGHGVVICSGGTAFLEKNEISNSTNCNLVLEGPRNIDNYVYNNRILNARGMGIFLLHCEKFLIAKNTITHNYNGIQAVTSVVQIQDNLIGYNKSSGVMLVEDCEVLLSENEFEKNKVAGLVCRGISRARMKRNIFKENKIEMLAEDGWDGIDDVQNYNQFANGADIRIPGKLACQLI